MQTMEQFVESLDVPETLVYDLKHLQQVLSTNTNKCVVYMCNEAVSREFVDWINGVIISNTPGHYWDFIESRGIIALFYYKQWMSIERVDNPGGGATYAALSDEEFAISNELRIKFVNLLIKKIEGV